MMSSILFTHSYFLRFDPKQWAIGQPYAPLGTLYSAALMRQQGYEVSLYDTMFAHSADDVIPAIEAQTPQFFVIYDDGFNYLTKMCLTNMREAAFKMCKLAKERGCTVIVSSSDSTDRYAEYLAEGADFVIIGEAEHTLLELCNHIKSGETEYAGIMGLAFNDGNKITKTPSRPVLKDLDSLPLPAWDLVDMENTATCGCSTQGISPSILALRAAVPLNVTGAPSLFTVIAIIPAVRKMWWQKLSC
jgi:anaerobic magnesium-protoporphyrin IX monomethyl ester cyclase